MWLSGRRLTAALVAGLLTIVLAGAFGAWLLGQGRGQAVASTAAGQSPAAAESSKPGANRTVQLEGSANHPLAVDVVRLLQGYFDAINERDYQAWRSSVSADQAAAETAEGWRATYSTTEDTDVRIRSIDDDPLRVRLTFTSHQTPALAPPDLPVDCIRWDVTYLLRHVEGRLVISGVDPTAQQKVACE